MDMEKVKKFAKEHKNKLIAIGATTVGAIGIAYGFKRLHDNAMWDNIVPWNADDTIVCVKKWTGSDKYNGNAVVALREVPIANLTEVASEAFSKAGLNEDTVIEQVVLTTIKEAK